MRGMQQQLKLWGRAAMLIVALLSCVHFATPAIAQSQSMPRDAITNALVQPVIVSRRMPLQIDAICWGWTGQALHADSHSPVSITLSSGTRAVSGVVSLVYPQDGSQNARVTVPFSTTPNVATAVQLQACPSHGTSEMRLEILADGRSFSLPINSPIAASASDVAMPNVAVGPLWVVLGPDLRLNLLLDGTTRTGVNGVNPGETKKYWDNASTPTVTPTQFSSAWIGYESLAGLVVRQQDLRLLTAVQRTALRTWLENGGRVAIVLEEAGDDWRQLLPDFLPDDLLTVSEVQRVSLSAITRNVLTNNSKDGNWDGAAVTPTNDAAPGPSIRSRLVTPSETARALGWRSIWSIDSRSQIADELKSENTSIAAIGAVGLGMLMVLGTDPANMPDSMNATQTANAWRDALDRLRDQSRNDPTSYQVWNYDSAGVMATGNSADSIVRARTPGKMFFVIVMFSILALALWVGPVGRRILSKRGLLSKNWAIALAAISVCTLIGLIAPRFFRSGTDDLGVLTLHDVFVDPQGKPIRVYTTTLRSVFAGSPDSFDVANIDLSKDDPQGQWWRGVSPIQQWWQVRLKAGSTTNILNTPAQRSSLAAGVIEPVDVSQWTLRLFLGIETGSASREFELPRVQVLRAATDTSRWQGDIRVKVEGEFDEPSPTTTRLIYRGKFKTDAQRESMGTEEFLRFSSSGAVANESDRANAQSMWQNQGESGAMSILHMPAIENRGDVINRIVESGDYAAVVLMRTSESGSKQQRVTNKTVYRIIAPVTIDPTRSATPPTETTPSEELP